MARIDWMHALPLLAAVAAVAALGAAIARRHALRRGLLDLPGERRSHTVPTPRGGGIGIAVGWALACLVLGWGGLLPAPIALAAVAGTVLVGGVGFVDDHRPLSAWWRIAAHLAAGVLLAAALAALAAPAWLVLLGLVGVPVLVNVWNFMDGIDGIAASQAALAAAGFALLSGDAGIALACMALLAACLGFLPSNFPRARIFLGDVGSGALGFALAVLACALPLDADADGWSLLPLVLLPLSAFLVDASLTLAGRIVRREHWWTAHVGHAYQRLAARAGSHVPVTLGYAAWTTIAVAIAITAVQQDVAVRMAAAGGCVAIGILAWRLLTAPGRTRRRKAPP